MGLVVRKISRKTIFVWILALLLLGTAVYWRVEHREEIATGSYEKLADLPSQFVVTCQKAGVRFNLPWELIASIYQVRLENDLINNYPDSGEVVSLAARLAPAAGEKNIKSIINRLNYSKVLTDEIAARTKLLQSKSFLLTKSYHFPYKENFHYVDTWGAEREGGKRVHEGTDIFAKEGTPIFSVGDGKVEKLGWNRLGGERVGIRSSDGVYFYYAHLSKINPELKIGMSVEAGALLGFTGHTGDAINTPDHLHFGIELENGKWINPYNFLQYWENQTK